jgi:CelD/BcsL family acetyltransferase involved in cellulose biosynthesis
VDKLMPQLKVERIDDAHGLERLALAWSALEARSRNTLPFRTHAWVSAWYKHLREQRFALRDSLALRAVRTENGTLVGVAPFVLTERPSVGPLRTRCLHFVGADPNVTEIRSPLFEPGLERACYAAIREELARSAVDVDWVRWSGLEAVHGFVENDPRVRQRDGVLCYVLPLPATWEELRASRPRNLKESLRKCYNSLKRDGLDFSLEVVTQAADVEASLGDFFRLHAARAVQGSSVPHRDVFSHPACRAFLLDVCRRFAERGVLRIFRLHVGGALVATRIGFVLHGTLYLYYSGFDPEFARYSVMTTLVAEAIRHAIDEGCSFVNLSTGRDESKLRWRPTEVRFSEASILLGGLLGWAKQEAFQAAARANGQGPVRHYAERLSFARRSS